jgi:hypothetical protein
MVQQVLIYHVFIVMKYMIIGRKIMENYYVKIEKMKQQKATSIKDLRERSLIIEQVRANHFFDLLTKQNWR